MATFNVYYTLSNGIRGMMPVDALNPTDASRQVRDHFKRDKVVIRKIKAKA